MVKPRTVIGAVKSVPSGLIPNRIILFTYVALPDPISKPVIKQAGLPAVTSKLWMKFFANMDPAIAPPD